MNILMLAPHPGVQGPVPKHTPILVEGLRALGVAVTLEHWGRHHDRESLPAKLRSRFGDIRRVRRLLRDGAFDLLLVKTAHDWNTLSRDIALLAAARGGPPVVLQFHGSDPGALASRPRWHPFRLATAWLMRLAGGSLVLSGEERRQWEAAFPRARFEVVKNPFVPLPGVDAERPARGDGAVFLFVGRLMADKGVFETLEAFARLAAGGPARLVIAGDGPAAARVRDRAAELGVAEAVTVAGYLGPEDLARVYAGADVFVLPTYWKEGFPTAILEAMQAGLPVITTPLRGAADHLAEGVHALYVPPRDPAALAAAMERLRDDAALRRALGEANRAKVREFSRDPVARDYLDALHRLRAPSA